MGGEDGMEDFFCVKCERLLTVVTTATVFHTGWIRIGTEDHHMGLCEDHKVTLPDFPPLEIDENA
jgi:hypothetical protein